MSWVKLSDTFAEDPRLEQAGPLALALHVAALCYCARQLTDGHLSRGTVRRLLELDDQDPHGVARSLVDVGMWETTDDGYRIVEYLKDQPSRKQAEDLRAKRAAAGRAGGQRSGEARRSNSEANTKQVASRSLEPRPVPSRPQPPPPTPSLADASAGTSPAAPLEAQGEGEDGAAETDLAGWIAREHGISRELAGEVVQRAQGDPTTTSSAAGRLSKSPEYRHALIRQAIAEQQSQQRAGRKCPHGVVDGRTIFGSGHNRSRRCGECEASDPAPETGSERWTA